MSTFFIVLVAVIVTAFITLVLFGTLTILALRRGSDTATEKEISDRLRLKRYDEIIKVLRSSEAGIQKRIYEQQEISAIIADHFDAIPGHVNIEWKLLSQDVFLNALADAARDDLLPGQQNQIDRFQKHGDWKEVYRKMFEQKGGSLPQELP